MLKQRIITAIVLVTGFMSALAWCSDTVFSFLIAIFLLVGAWEWSGLSGLSGLASRVSYVVFTAVAMAGLWWFGAGESGKQFAFQGIVYAGVLWWIIAVACVAFYPLSSRLWGHCAIELIIGLFVLVPPLFAIAGLIEAENGRMWLLFIILLVASADIGAFFCGRRFGHRKLAARVSPGKTLEGLVGGLACALLVATVVFAYMFWTQHAPGKLTTAWWPWLLVAFVTVLASVLGDLNESMIKRHRGVKDSGTILPGHGGVLDRVDSLSAALPVFVTLAWVLGLIYPPAGGPGIGV